jgi:protein O-mannosyl-transferase
MNSDLTCGTKVIMLDKINIIPLKQKFIVYIILTIVTFVVYWQVHQYEFVNLDDFAYVTENRNIQSGITSEGTRWAFSTKFFGLWNPLVWLSFMLDYQLFGLNAGGYHVTNLILHTLSALLLFWLFNRMTGAIWKSAFVAAFFALHPLHVESVAWIAERKDVLSAFFWMMTLCLYVYYTEKPIIRRYLLVLFSFVCALMSKPMVITLPVIMILLDYWPLSRCRIGIESHKKNSFLQQLKEKMPFFISSLIFIVFTLYNSDKSGVKYFSLVSRIDNALVSFVIYLEKTFWPHDMASFYSFPINIPLWQVIGASLLIIFITTIVIIMAKRLPYLFVGWIWYVITIAPVIGIIQISVSVPYAMADRYHYLPSIGIAIMMAWGIPSLLPSKQIRKNILFPVAITFLAILAVLSWQQCGYWKNSVNLWSHALRVTKGNCLIYLRLGNAFGRLGQYQKAIDNFNEAIRMQADNTEAYNGRGISYNKIGQYQLAIEDFNKAIGLNPNYTAAYKNRGNVYLTHGNNTLGCHDAQKACALEDCELLEIAKGRGYCR